MTNEEIIVGVDLARKALHFAIFSHGKVKAGECREAILILFGEEVYAALAREFSPTMPPNEQGQGEDASAACGRSPAP